jgi:hypothetical protein
MPTAADAGLTAHCFAVKGLHRCTDLPAPVWRRIAVCALQTQQD